MTDPFRPSPEGAADFKAPPINGGGLLKENPEPPTVVFDSASITNQNNNIYYRSQGKAFGFELPLDPSRINGTPSTPVQPKREDFPNDEEYEKARSKQADALASQEKHALSGVPFS